eukprot:gene6205-7903_t
MEACLLTQQPFVVDNTNPTQAERAKYIAAARARGYKIVGYYFRSNVTESLGRNSQRSGKENIPEKSTQPILPSNRGTMKFDELDKKMRVYETAHDQYVLPDMYMVARIDGRGFT